MSLWDDQIEAAKRNELQRRKESMCEHMLAFVRFGKEQGVSFGGCGECGSPWMECKVCNKLEDDFGSDSSELV